MRRYLVVAHQTLGSPELLETMRDLLATGPCTFHLLVPEFHGGAGLTWTEGQVRVEAARKLEEARLRFLAAGIPVSGEIGDANPVDAVSFVLRRDGDDVFAEVIVSTLPTNVSRWLRMDAPRRIERIVRLPVRHVVGHPADDA